MNAQNLETSVLIVGGGPTGMVAALCLARQGVPCVLLERRDTPEIHPKAHELSARSIEILLELGIGFEALSAEASPHEDAARVLVCGTITEEFGCIDLGAEGIAAKYREHTASPQPFLNISQVEVEKVIRAQVLATPLIDVRYGQQWESLEQDADGVTCQVTDRASGRTYSVRSRYLICADGAGSRTRRALNIEMNGPEKLRDFVNAYFQADLSGVVRTRGKLYFIFSPQAPGAVFMAHHVEKRWVFHMPVETPNEKIEDYTPEVMRRCIQAALGRDDVPIEITSMSHWRMTAQIAERFRQGRAFLVGDAAHRFPPTGGLGLNSGVGDAHNLCWKIAMVLRGLAGEALLDTYESERRPVVRRNCDESRLNFERMSEIAAAFGVDVKDARWVSEKLTSSTMRSLPAPIRSFADYQVRRFAEGVLSRYHKDPAVRERVLTAIAQQTSHFDRIGLDLGYTYERGAVLADGTPAPHVDDPVSTYVPSTRPGARLPHFWLDGNTRQTSSRSLVDYGSSVLVLGAGVHDQGEDLEGLESTHGLSVMRLDTPIIPLCHQAAVHTQLQIEADGALLLRPDGHVAWRQARGVKATVALARSILEQVYGR